MMLGQQTSGYTSRNYQSVGGCNNRSSTSVAISGVSELVIH